MPVPTFRRLAGSSSTYLPTHTRSRRSSTRTLGVGIVGLCLFAFSGTVSWLFAPSAKAHVNVPEVSLDAHGLDAHGGFHGAGIPHDAGFVVVADVYRSLLGKSVAVALPMAATTALTRMRWQSLASCLPFSVSGNKGSSAHVAGFEGNRKRKWNVDFYLVFCFIVWYFGNYQHNICNKLALKASGGAAGYPFTIATCQLAIGSVYALFLWVAPDARLKPTMTFKDWVATLPVSFAAAVAHGGSVFALSAGALSFGQIVKAAEPAFAAGVGTFIYGAKVSVPRLLCLIPIIGGVALSSMAELDFTWAALVAASVANSAAAFRGNENKKLFATSGIRDRIGSVGNQFAVTTINALLFLLPLAIYREGHKFHTFLSMIQNDRDLLWNVVLSGWWFYIYNEVATVIIEKTGPVSQSVANTAKRAIVIILGAMVLGESLNATKLIGCGIAIGGVFLYTEIDKLVAKFPKKVPTPTNVIPPLA